MKAQGKKVKVNAILDDASNETFLNEEVAGALGLKEGVISNRESSCVEQFCRDISDYAVESRDRKC